MTKRCSTCVGEGFVNVTIGSAGAEADLCPTCGGSGVVRCELRDWIREQTESAA